SGKLPAGMTLDANTGTLSGTPNSSAGSPFAFSISATDLSSGNVSQPQAFSLIVGGSSTPIPDLTVTMSHAGNFRQGQMGGVYVITVGNSGGVPTSGAVTATLSIPTGLTLVSMSGNGWSCPAGGIS